VTVSVLMKMTLMLNPVCIREFRLMFIVNDDIIHHHMTPYAGIIHDEILNFCKPGTTFHCKHIPLEVSF